MQTGITGQLYSNMALTKDLDDAILHLNFAKYASIQIIYLQTILHK